MSSAAAAALQQGDSGSDVALLQERLQSIGYEVGGADGSFGQQTEAAVKALQADRGLEVDGLVGEATWAALRLPGTPVSRGRTQSRYSCQPYFGDGRSLSRCALSVGGDDSGRI